MLSTYQISLATSNSIISQASITKYNKMITSAQTSKAIKPRQGTHAASKVLHNTALRTSAMTLRANESMLWPATVKPMQ